MAIAIGILVLVLITIVFHFLSPWWFTPIAADWGSIDTTVIITFWVTGIVFIVLNAFLIAVILSYRHRAGVKAHYEPESHKLEWWLTVITTVGVIAMLAPGLWVWNRIITVPDDAEVVEVVGQQWHWSFRFPGADGVLGQVDIAAMTADNPLGLKADDPAGLDDILVTDGEVHLQTGKTYKFVLRSKDVLHNFTVPQFRVKMDLVPGMTPYVWATLTRSGRFDILCEELCGIGHFAMRGSVVVEEQTAFDQWLKSQPTFAQVLQARTPDIAAGQAQYAVCSACHGAQGEGNQMLNAPKLAGQASWYLTRQLNNFKHGLRGAESTDPFAAQMAPMAAILADDAAIHDVVSYIAELPDSDPPATIAGDVARGAEIYLTCQSCHGTQAQGIWATNAPRLNGMNDWYLLRQLQNYKQGTRGSHPADLYGKQMNLMTGVLRSDQVMTDLLAYINTL